MVRALRVGVVTAVAPLSLSFSVQRGGWGHLREQKEYHVAWALAELGYDLPVAMRVIGSKGVTRVSICPCLTPTASRGN